MLMSARMPVMSILPQTSLTVAVRPQLSILGVDGVEFGLDLRRIAASAALQDRLIGGEHFLLVFLDVTDGGKHLRRREAQRSGDGSGVPTLKVIIEDVVDGDACPGDLGASPAVDDLIHRQASLWGRTLFQDTFNLSH